MSIPRLVIVGAGFAGIGIAIQLQKAGYGDFRILEKGADFGGTWRENTYPGAACDIPSHLYSFSFEPNPDWSRQFSRQPEIHDYARACARKHGLHDKTRFNTEVTEARFDERHHRWRITTDHGEVLEAEYLISATGQLNRPAYPPVPGIETFEGVSFHSAQWDHQADFTGKKVAVIGNAASAIQLVPPLAEKAAELTVFQRSANWILPRRGSSYSEKVRERFRRWPGLRKLYRNKLFLERDLRFHRIQRQGRMNRRLAEQAQAYLKAVIPDPELRRKLTPDYPLGCKRVLISDDYYPALRRDNVHVNDRGVKAIAADGVIDGAGRKTGVDAVIYATGFQSHQFLFPMSVYGEGGRALKDDWEEGARAYMGMTVAGFPNLFVLFGPNTSLGHNSIIFMLECQFRYIIQCLDHCEQHGLLRMAVKADAQERYDRDLQAGFQGTTWAGGCSSWYKSASGRIINNWTGRAWSYWWQTRRPRFRDFEFQ